MSIATRTPDDVRLNDPDADLVEALRRRDEQALMTLSGWSATRATVWSRHAAGR